MRIKRQDKGSVADIMVTGIFVLAMMVVMLSFFENLKLIHQKTEVDQIARRYILRMETVGGLTAEDEVMLREELQSFGVTDVDLAGTTMGSAGYGAPIRLRIAGVLGGTNEFEEVRVSTAKH